MLQSGFPVLAVSALGPEAHLLPSTLGYQVAGQVQGDLILLVLVFGVLGLGLRVLALWKMLPVGPFLLVGIVVLVLGWPCDLWTWFLLALGLPLGLLTLGKRMYLAAILPLLYYGCMLVPLESHNHVDIVGGRWAVYLFPWGSRFGGDTANTLLLKSYLGPLPPRWQHASIRSALFSDWRDGNERVRKHNMIFQPRLPQMLTMLPNEEARIQVLRSATDPDNLMATHQTLLLTCLEEWGYPPGHDSASWWERHRHLFQQEYDPDVVARQVTGWSELLNEASATTSEVRSQLQAARYQETGRWGGIPEVARALHRLREGEPYRGEVWNNGLKEVAWWNQARLTVVP